jgi:Domain of unknown function (DUF4288)
MTAKTIQHWYIATLVVASRVEDDHDVQTCDEQIRAIRAPNAEVAYEKALRIGKNEENSYKNMYDQTVTWEFIGLENLEELDDSMHDGVEIRSRLFGHKDPSSLVRSKPNLSVFLAESNPYSTEYRIKTENIPASDE